MITSHEYNHNFNTFIRKGTFNDKILNEGRMDVGGHYLFPDGDYIEAISRVSLFRRLGTVLYATASKGTIETITATAEAEVVEEFGPFPEDCDEFSTQRFKSYKIATIAKLKNTFINDTDFNVQKYLSDEFSKRFGKAEEKVFLNGNGNNEPKGLLNAAEIGVNTLVITYDDVIGLYFSLKSDYRENAVWVMNDTTALAVRKLKDEDGNYLWHESDNTILSKSVVISNYMTNEQKPLVFGDLSYYWIIIRQKLSVKVIRELYAHKSITGYPAYERVDGQLVRAEAVKLLVVGESGTESVLEIIEESDLLNEGLGQ